jgi:hypothetical protein
MTFPNFPGVPALLNNPLPAAALIAAPLISNLLDMFSQKWGIFYSLPGEKIGTQAIKPDSFLDLDYSNDANIPTFPQEQGAFASYNKVQSPRSYTISMSKGGSKKEMTDFLTELEKLQATLELFTIVTPNRSYPRTNITKVEYKRSSYNGAGMIVATLHFTEIRQASEAYQAPGTINTTYTQPSAQAVTNNGTVYPSVMLGVIQGAL